jgi:amino acid transporter
VLLLAFGVAVASRSWLVVAALAVVAALVLLVVALGVDRAEARLNAYEKFARTPRGIAFTSIIAVVAGVVWLAFARGSDPAWTILLPPVWTVGILVNVWRLMRRGSEPQG